MMKDIDILIFSGQSNMQGQSDMLSDCACVENAYEFKFIDNCFVPLKNPTGENIRYDKTAGYAVMPDTDIPKWLDEHVLGASCYGNTNLVPEFCRSYIKETGRTVLAVHCAKGSTIISSWINSSPMYNMLTEKALAAIKLAQESGYNIKHIFFIWLQGESDAICGVKKDEYKERLYSLYNSLKSDLDISKFGIIKVGHFTHDEKDLEIMSAQEEVCKEDDSFVMLTDIAPQLSLDSNYLHPYISGHYNAKGLERLGSEAGKMLGKSSV